MEYYGYKDRGEAGNPIVDWGKIASDLTQNLTKIEEGREAKRKEIDEVTQNYVDEINKVDVGHSQSMGTFIQDAANSTKQYTLMQQKLYKQGKIDNNQYKMNLQNQKDSWGAFTGVAKNWNANYDRFVDLQSKGLVGQQAADMMEKLGRMQDLQNKKAYIDPASGNLYAAEYDKTGKIDTTKFQPTSATTLLKLMGDTPLKVNVTAEVAKNNKIAEFKKMTAGSMVSDPTARPGYSNMSKQIANSVLSTDRAIGSVLMDTVGGYKATFQTDTSKYTPEEKELSKAGKLITYKLDGTGNYNPSGFTPDQMEDAKNAVQENLRFQLGYEAEPIKTTGVKGGGGSDRGLTAGQLLEYQAKQPIFGDPTPDKGMKGKTVVDVRNAAISIGKSGDVQNITQIGYSPRLKSLYLLYDNYTGVKDEWDFASGKKMDTVVVKEGDPSFSSILKQLNVDKSQLETLRSGGATTTTVPTATRAEWKTAGWTDQQINQAAVVVTFAGEIGSIISTGSDIYAGAIVSNVVGSTRFIGVIVSRTNNSITINCSVAGGSLPLVTDLVLCSKNLQAESYGLRGYFMQFELENTATSRVQLYNVQSSIFKSYP